MTGNEQTPLEPPDEIIPEPIPEPDPPREFDSESILDTVKKALGIDHLYEYFNTDIILSINFTFLILNQLGVGTKTIFTVSDYTSKWNSFFDNNADLEAVKQYVYLKVRTTFDPPANSFILDAMERQISELEWRLRTQIERDKDREDKTVEDFYGEEAKGDETNK